MSAEFVAACIAELPGFAGGQETERAAVRLYIERRAVSVEALVNRGRMDADDGAELAHWLRVLASDIRQGLHDMDAAG